VESLFVWMYIPETRNRSLEEIASSWASPQKVASVP
jgi:hypothetical protein